MHRNDYALIGIAVVASLLILIPLGVGLAEAQVVVNATIPITYNNGTTFDQPAFTNSTGTFLVSEWVEPYVVPEPFVEPEPFVPVPILPTGSVSISEYIFPTYPDEYYLYDDIVQQLAKRTIIGENYNSVEDYITGEATWTSTIDRIQDGFTTRTDGTGVPTWKNYVLEQSGQKVIFNSNSIGGLVYDLPTCSYSINENGYNGNTVVPSVSAVATGLVNGEWTNLQVNNSLCDVNVTSDADGIKITSTKSIQLDPISVVNTVNGTTTLVPQSETFTQVLDVDSSSGIKETWKVWKNDDTPLGISQTIHTGSEIEIAGQTIDIEALDGQSFDRQYIIDNEAEILAITESVSYDFDEGIDSLTGINIIYDSDYKVNLDYASGDFTNYLEIDPTFGYNIGSYGMERTVNSVSNNCGAWNVSGATMKAQTESNSGSNGCQVGWISWDTSSIPDGSVVTNTNFRFDMLDATNGRNCDYKPMQYEPSVTSGATRFTDILDGTAYVSNDATCNTIANDHVIDLGASADTDLQNQLTSDWFALGFSHYNQVRDGSHHWNNPDITTLELEVTYALPTIKADPPTSLVATDGLPTSLTWTAPTNFGFDGEGVAFTGVDGYGVARTTSSNSLVELPDNSGTNAGLDFTDNELLVHGIETINTSTVTTDEFLTDTGYTFNSGNSISGGVLTAQPAGSLGFTKPLGFTMEDTWVMRVHGWEVQSGYSWSSAMSYMFGFSDTATPQAYTGSGDAYGFAIFNRSAGGMVNTIMAHVNGVFTSGGNGAVGEGGTDLVTGTKYYIEMKKTGAGDGELRIYSDSNFSTLHTTAYLTGNTMSNPSGLNHLSLQGQTTGGSHVVHIDKISIYNGVTDASILTIPTLVIEDSSANSVPITSTGTSTSGTIGTAIQNPDLTYTDTNLPDNTDVLSVGGFVKLDASRDSTLDGTNTGAISTTGLIGTAYDLNGSTDLAVAGGTVSDWKYLTDGSDWTFNGWYKFDSFSQSPLLFHTRDNGASTNTGVWLTSNTSGDILSGMFRGVSGSYVFTNQDTGANIPTITGNWNMITMIHDGTAGTIKVYVNGVLGGTISSTGNAYSTGTSPYTPQFGGDINTSVTYTDHHDGQIDEITFYKDKTLSASEITTLYNSGNGDSTPDTNSLFAHYDFDTISSLENQVTIPPANTKLLGLNDVTFSVGATSASVDNLVSTAVGAEQTNDSFGSSSGWTQQGTKCTISGGTASCSNYQGGSNQRLHIPIGTTLQDDWTLKFDVSGFTASLQTTWWKVLALCDSNAMPYSTTGDCFNIEGKWGTYLGVSTLFPSIRDNGVTINPANQYGVATTDGYYTVVKSGDTAVISAYSDSARTTLAGSTTISGVAGITGLTHIHIAGYNNHEPTSRNSAFNIDNLIIDDSGTVFTPITIISATSLTDNTSTPQHYAVTRGASNDWTIYQNGASVATATDSTSLGSNGASVSNVVWDSATMSGYTVSGNTITDSVGGWGSKARSVSTFTDSTGGAVDYQTGSNTDFHYLGIGKDAFGSYTDNDYALYATNSGDLQPMAFNVSPNGNTSVGTYTSSDTITLSMSSSGVVTALKNGVSIYTFPTTASGTYYAHVNSYPSGASVSATITGGSPNYTTNLSGTLDEFFVNSDTLTASEISGMSSRGVDTWSVLANPNDYVLLQTELPDGSVNESGSTGEEIDFTDNEFLLHGFETTNYKVHTFTTVGTDTFQVTAGSGDIDVLMVAGGGGGGTQVGSGGGAGGFVYYKGYPITSGSYTTTVGVGGSKAVSAGTSGTVGGNSGFTGLTTAVGGGGGSVWTSGGETGGGSGAGGMAQFVGGAVGQAGTINQGNAGGTGNNDYASGGGGGAKTAGGMGVANAQGGSGGDGYTEGIDTVYNFQTGSTTTFDINGLGNAYAGGGGGGGSGSVSIQSSGGIGGGGNGGSGSATGTLSTAGSPNTGGGGGGGRDYPNGFASGASNGADGGSGIVIIRYLDDGSITATGGTVTSITAPSLSDSSINAIPITLTTGSSTTGSIGDAIQSPDLTYADTNLPDNTDVLSVGGYVKLDTTLGQVPITWDSSTVDGFTISGSTVIPTHTSNGWDNSVQSTQSWSPSTGGGEIEFTVNGDKIMTGFSKDPYPASSVTNSYFYVDYAIHLSSPSGNIAIYELGSFIGNYGTWVSGDTFKQTMDSNGLVKYYQNNNLIYTSTTTASGTYYLLHTVENTSPLTATYLGTIPPTDTKLLGLNDVTFNVGATSASVVEDVLTTVTTTEDFSSYTTQTDANNAWSAHNMVTPSTQSVNIANDNLAFTWAVNGVQDIGATTYDLGAVQDNSWKLRWEVTHSTLDRTIAYYWVGLSDNPTATYSSTQNAIQSVWAYHPYAPYADSIMGVDKDSNTNGNQDFSVFLSMSTGTTYYLELERVDATTYTTSAYTDDTYTTLLTQTATGNSNPATGTGTVTATTENLRYITVAGYSHNYYGGGYTVGVIDNIKFINDEIITTPLLTATGLTDNTSTPQHYAFTRDSSNGWTIYQNGVSQATATDSTSLGGNSATVSGYWESSSSTLCTLSGSSATHTGSSSSPSECRSVTTVGTGDSVTFSQSLDESAKTGLSAVGSSYGSGSQNDIGFGVYLSAGNGAYMMIGGSVDYLYSGSYSGSDNWKMTVNSSGNIEVYQNNVLRHTFTTGNTNTEYYLHTVSATTNGYQPVITSDLTGSVTTVAPYTTNISGSLDEFFINSDTLSASEIDGISKRGTTVSPYTTTSTSFNDNTAVAGNEYYYKVYSVTDAGYSLASNIDSAMTVSQANAPTGLTSSVNSNAQIVLDWTASTDLGNGSLISMNIQRDDGTGWTTIATTSSTSPPYTDTTAVTSQTYDYRVASINEAGVGAYSNTSTATAGIPADAIANVVTTVPDTNTLPYDVQVTFPEPLSWGTGTAVSYDIYESATGTGAWTQVASEAYTSGQFTATVSISNGQPLTEYFYKVLAVSTHGTSADSNVDSVTTADSPAQPNAPTLAINDPDNAPLNISVTFANPSDGGSAINSWFVERWDATTANWSTVVASTGTTDLAYPDNSVLANTEYKYRVSAINGIGTSAVSSESTSITTPTIPDAPTALVATTIDTASIELNWTLPASDGGSILQSFSIQNDATGSFAQIDTVSGTATTFTHSGLSDATNYNYQVIAINNVGSSSPSNQDSAWTMPNAPVGLTASAISSTDTLELEWTQPTGTVTEYKIQRALFGASNWSTSQTVSFGVACSGATCTVDDTGLSSGTQFQFRIIAVNLGGDSAESNVASNWTVNDAPTQLAVTLDPNNSSESYLSWTSPSGTYTGFQIERETPVGGGWVTIESDTGLVNILTDTGLTLTTEYNYRISSINLGGMSVASAPVSMTTLSPPDPPTGITFDLQEVGSNLRVQVSWTEPSNLSTGTLSGYMVERNDGSGWSITANTGTTPSFIDTDIQRGVNYDYRVSATTQIATGSPSATNSFEFVDGTFDLPLTAVQGNTLESQSSFTKTFGDPVSYATNILIVKHSADNAVITTVASDNNLILSNSTTIINGNKVGIELTSGVTQLDTQFVYETSEYTYTGYLTTIQDGVTHVFSSTNSTVAPLNPFGGSTFANEFRDEITYQTSTVELYAEPAGYDAVLRYQHQDPTIEPFFYGFENVQANNTSISPVLDDKDFYVSVYINPEKFDFVIDDPQTGLAHIECNENSPLNCPAWDAVYTPSGEVTHSLNPSYGALTDIPDGIQSDFVTKSFKSPDSPQSFGLEPLGDLFGMPMVFIFVIGLGAVFTGRSAQMGVIFIAVTIGIMLYMGYISFDFGTSGISTAVTWGVIIVAMIGGILVGKRWS